MTKLRRFAPVFALAAALVFSTGILQGQSSDRSKALGKKLMCTCGGCTDTAGECSHPGAGFSGPCDTAKATIKEMDDRIAQGQSDDSILQSFVQEHGEAALAAPPATGFNLVAWTFPGIVFTLGLGLVVLVIRHWRSRPAPVPAAGPPVSAEFLERARRQIDRETDN